MNELKVRFLSGFIYTSLLILSTLDPLLLWTILSVFGIITVYELSKLLKKEGYVYYMILFALFSIFIYVNFLEDFINLKQLNYGFLTLTILFSLLLMADLFLKKRLKIASISLFLFIFYLTSGFIYLGFVSFYNHKFKPSIYLGCFIIIWVNDSFAYIVGKNMGKKKLFPSISPKKTVEGFVGGITFALLSSFFIFYFTETLNLLQWTILSLIISVLGTIGDLIESKLKRNAQVKDSGKIMPGHGGLLDRLDSIIFAAPFIYLFLLITAYVS